MRKIFIFFFAFRILFADQIETFYGPLEVEEKVVLELLAHPAFQRLKKIHQYGVSYYSKSHTEEYNRYDHSVGVFAILRIKNRPLKEQIAGLLHDVSHTVFSHVGDWIFEKQGEEKDYQNSIHITFLEKSGLAEVLRKYGYNPKEMNPVKAQYPALEQPLPNLCADRIDYNIQGAFYKGFITKKEALSILQHLQFEKGEWVSNQIHLMKKLARSSLLLTRSCWGGVKNYLASQLLADALKRACKIDLISMSDIHYGTDDEVWEILRSSQDALIQECIERIVQIEKNSVAIKKGEKIHVSSKFRGIDPFILLNGKKARITELDSSLSREFHKVRKEMQIGWDIYYP